MQKVDDESKLHRYNKKFLDLIAIASKNKVPVNQKERKMRKEALLVAEVDEQENMNALQQQSQRIGDMTFLTQSAAADVNQVSNMARARSMKRGSPKGRQVALAGNNGSNWNSTQVVNAKNVTIDEVANEANRVSALTKTECAISNVDEE